MDKHDRASKGGKARAAKLSSEQRSESARRAVQARWAKRHRSPESYTGCTSAITVTIKWPAADDAQDGAAE